MMKRTTRQSISSNRNSKFLVCCVGVAEGFVFFFFFCSCDSGKYSFAFILCIQCYALDWMRISSIHLCRFSIIFEGATMRVHAQNNNNFCRYGKINLILVAAWLDFLSFACSLTKQENKCSAHTYDWKSTFGYSADYKCQTQFIVFQGLEIRFLFPAFFGFAHPTTTTSVQSTNYCYYLFSILHFGNETIVQLVHSTQQEVSALKSEKLICKSNF